MSYSEWLLIYLLVGFALHFCGSMLRVSRIEWQWELAAVALWPVATLMALIGVGSNYRKRRKYIDR